MTNPRDHELDPHPGELRRQMLTLAGRHVQYIDEGRGPPILLLHGAPLVACTLVRLIVGLRHHFRVLAPDLPGFGDSEALSDARASLSEYAKFVREFATQLELRALTIFVHDSSASFGLAAAADIRERVSGIVIADTVPMPLSGRARVVAWLLRYVVCSSFMRVVNRRWNLLPWLVVRVAPWRRPFVSEHRPFLYRCFRTPAQRDRILDLFEAMARDSDFMRRTWTSIVDRLARKPALIIYGRFDPVRWVGGPRRFARAFHSHEIWIVPGEEHFPMLAEGTRVAKMIVDWHARQLGAVPQDFAGGPARAFVQHPQGVAGVALVHGHEVGSSRKILET